MNALFAIITLAVGLVSTAFFGFGWDKFINDEYITSSCKCFAIGCTYAVLFINLLLLVI